MLAKRISFLQWAACILLLTSCATGKQHYNGSLPAVHTLPESPQFTIYGIGDAGEYNKQSKKVIADLASRAMDDTHPGMVIYLGDNVYPAGMPIPIDPGYAHAREILLQQINPLQEYPGRIYFIPGNHDWNEFKPGGLEAIRRQGAFLDSLNDPRIRMIPANGCGDPVWVQPSENLAVLFMDSQWWIQDWDKEPDINKGCGIKSREAFLSFIRASLKEYEDKQVIIAIHHPLGSRGPHGGYYTVRDHLFPLSKVVPWLYLPLPVIGSVYPWYRTVFGHPQDVRHRNYRRMKEAILNEISDMPNVIFLAGHDHSLQYSFDQKHHYIVSGSGSKQNAIANGPGLIYGHKAGGYAQLDFYTDHSVWLTIYEIGKDDGILEPVYCQSIIGPSPR